LRIVQAASEGVVSIEVKENQVRKGDAIAIIDDSQLQTKKEPTARKYPAEPLTTCSNRCSNQLPRYQITAETRLMNRTVASAQADLGLQQRDHKDRQITTQTQVEEASAALS